MTPKEVLARVRSAFTRTLDAEPTSYIPPLEVERAEQIFYIQYLQPGMIAFDVGANIGELSLLFSRFVGPTGEVHSFEASRETFARLETIIDLANRSNVRLNCLAVTDHLGGAQLRVYDRDHAGWTTLADRPLDAYGIDVAPARSEDVESTTIDAYCEERGIEQIDLLKIDVEGAEYQVLRGAEKMIRKKRVICCVFEFGSTTFDMGNHPEQIRAYLKDCGYEIRNVVQDGSIFPGGSSPATAQFSMHISIPTK